MVNWIIKNFWGEYKIWEMTKNTHKKTQQQNLNLICLRYFSEA